MGRKSKTFLSSQIHLREEGEGTEVEQKRAKERPCMCMHTTNKTDRHIFFLCLVCDQPLLEGPADRKTSCTWTPLDAERGRDRHDDGT